MRSARKYPHVLLLISVPGNFHGSLPSLEAAYRPHFPNILYCVRHKITTTFLDRWKVSVVRIGEDPAPLPCLLAAGEIHYSVRGVLHIGANMFVDSQRGRVASFVDSLVWMTGDFHAYSPSTLAHCHRRAISCRHVDRDALARFGGTIDDSPSLSGRQKAKLRACLAKLDSDPTWISAKSALWISDLVMYVPSHLIDRLAELRAALSPSGSAQHDLLVSIMFECDQLTVNYLRHSVDVKALNETDYVVPFAFEKVNSLVDVTKQFCSYIEQFKSAE